MEDQNYTIKDIAQMAGVSAGTVDRVLHNRGDVSQKSKEKVEITPTQLASEIANDMMRSERESGAMSPEVANTPYTSHSVLNPHNPDVEELYNRYGNGAIENNREPNREQNSDEHTR